MRKTLFALAAACLLPAAAPAATAKPKALPPPTACDRACLVGVADAYLAALVAHDPAKAPIAAGLVTVENTKRIQPGEGLWQGLTAGPTAFRIVIPDAAAGQVAWLGVLQENNKPIELGIRLKVEGGKVVEAEHLVARDLRETSLKNLQTPRAAFSRDVVPGYRDTRPQLLRIGASYYDALDNNNGSLAPMADDCVRRENGMQTDRNPVPDDPEAKGAGIGYLGSLGCTAQIDSGAFQYITHIDNRRVWIADEQTGLAVGFSHFRHAFTQNEFPLYGVPWQSVQKMDYKPFDLPAMHIFKIWGGKIHEIEAIGYTTGYNIPTGWEK
jgi:hypothetical protein